MAEFVDALFRLVGRGFVRAGLLHENLRELELAREDEGVLFGVEGGLDLGFGGITIRHPGHGLEIALNHDTLAHAFQPLDHLGLLFPAGGPGFLDQNLLKNEGAHGLVEKGGVFFQGGAVGRGEIVEIGADFFRGDFLVADAGDGFGLAGAEGEEAEAGGGEEAGWESADFHGCLIFWSASLSWSFWMRFWNFTRVVPTKGSRARMASPRPNFS